MPFNSEDGKTVKHEKTGSLRISCRGYGITFTPHRRLPAQRACGIHPDKVQRYPEAPDYAAADYHPQFFYHYKRHYRTGTGQILISHLRIRPGLSCSGRFARTG